MYPIRYEHFKGGIYQVEDIATHSETGDLLIVYRGSNGKCWIRPIEMFEELVPAGTFERLRFRSDKVPRFRRVNLEYVPEGCKPYWEQSGWKPGDWRS